MVFFNALAELLSVWMIGGTIAIDTIGLGAGLRWAIILMSAVWIVVTYRASFRTFRFNLRDQPFGSYKTETLLVAIASTGWIIALAHRTTESIRSPWWVLTPAWVLIPLTLLLIGSRARTNSLRIVATFASTILLSTLLVSIYAFGYGFDSHIHSAALRILTEHGQILPRTPYYIGFYALILIVHSFVPFISISFIQQWLPPLLAALIISGSIVRLAHNRSKFAILPLLFLFPLSWMGESTPQALAFSGTLLASLLLAINAPLRVSALVTLATISIHPLSGIPLSVALLYRLLPARIGTATRVIVMIAGALLVPALFVMLGFLWGHPMSWSIPKLSFSLPIAREFNPWLDIVFTLFWNRWIAVVVLIGVVMRLSRQLHKPLCKPSEWALLAGASSAAMGAYLLSGFESFPNVIVYETTDYPARLFQTALVLLLPVVLPHLGDAVEHLRLNMRRSVVWVSAPLYFLLIVMGLFTLYPIDVDGYHVDKGYNMSIHDLHAVEWIQHDARDTPYIVLANQSVSAAAIESFGFRTYFTVRNQRTNKTEQVFYYPIPTGGLLYPYYLQFVYESPRRSTVIAAMERIGVSRAYVVINAYWRNSASLITSAQMDSDADHSIDQGAVWIFRYDRDGPTTK